MIRLIATLLSLITTFLVQAQEYASKGSQEKKEGCLYPGMMILGVICVWPIISGILGLLGKAVYYLVIFALIVGGIYLLFEFIKSLFSKD